MALTEKEELEMMELEREMASHPSQSVQASQGEVTQENWAPAPIRGAVGVATGVGEALFPPSIPHNLETLGLAGAHALGLEKYKDEQPIDPNLPWYKRAGQALQNAGKQEHIFPRLRVEDVAPYVRAGARSAVDLANLRNPEFSDKLTEEQGAQQAFNDSLPAGTRAVGEAIPGLVALGGLASKGFKAMGVGNAAEESANVRRVAALGGGKRAIKNLMQNDQVQELGNQLKTDNVMGPFTSREAIQSNIENAQGGYGRTIENIVDEADLSNGGQGIIPTSQVVDKAVNEVWAPLAERSTARQAAGKIADEIESFQKQHGESLLPGDAPKKFLTLEELQQFKKDLSDNQKMFERTGDSPAVNGYKQLYGVFNKSGEDALNSVEGQLPEGMGLSEFKAAKKGYGINETARQMIEDRNAREAANRMFSGSDYGAGAGGAMVSAATKHNPIWAMMTGLGSAALNKVARGYGNQMTAAGWQKLADSINNPINPAFGPAARTSSVLNLVTPNKENR